MASFAHSQFLQYSAPYFSNRLPIVHTFRLLSHPNPSPRMPRTYKLILAEPSSGSPTRGVLLTPIEGHTLLERVYGVGVTHAPQEISSISPIFQQNKHRFMLIFTQPIEVKRSYQFDLNFVEFCLMPIIHIGADDRLAPT